MTTETPPTHPVLPQELLDTLEGTCYLVSPAGLLLAYGQTHWDRFAWENGAPELTQPDRVIGRHLDEFIQGREAREARAVMAEALLRGARESIVYFFRCDAPDHRREMRMYISAVRRGREVVALCYQSRTLSDVPRPSVDILAPPSLEAPVDAPMLDICSYCKRVRFPSSQDAAWVSAEQYYARGGSAQVRLSHGICPQCFETIVEPLYAELSAP